MRIIQVLAVLICLGITSPGLAGPASADQLGEYAGTAKTTYYDLADGKKIKDSVPCTMAISSANGNTVVLNVDGFENTATGCPFAPNRGSFFHGNPGSPTITSTFKFTGKGDKVVIKGKFMHINPYLIQEGSFVLKKIN